MNLTFKGYNMEYEIRLYKCAPQGIFGEHGQWEIWQCVDGEWEHIPDEVYSYIDSEDKENQMFQAELGLHRLMTVVKEICND
jgi:hypothetical protein